MRCRRYLHKANPRIIHRDLKPENIMLTLECEKVVAKLGDFGLHAVLKKPKWTYTETDEVVLNEIPSSTESRTRVMAILHLCLTIGDSYVLETENVFDQSILCPLWKDRVLYVHGT